MCIFILEVHFPPRWELVVQSPRRYVKFKMNLTTYFSDLPVYCGESFYFIKGRLESTLCGPQCLDRTRLELNH